VVRPRISDLLTELERELHAFEAQAQLRRLSVLKGVDLCSNDYLGLSHDARLRESLTTALAEGAAVCSTGSRLLSGNARIWEELEAEIAEFMNAEAALYFNSGYAANVGLLSSVIRPDDIVFSDSANHASIIDGLRLAGARKVIFPHLDLDILEAELRKHNTGRPRKFIVVESLFSMDGDRAPLAYVVALASKYGAELIVDEAHATGVLGPEGRGLVAAAGFRARSGESVLATVHPCGKALAGIGAFVCCSEVLKQYLVNRARPFIFSTALPPYVAAQMRVAISIAASADAERSKLASLSGFLRKLLRDAGFDTGRSDSQIIPVILGDNERAAGFASRLVQAGFGVRAIRPPTVPAGTSRLRLSLNVTLSMATLARFADELVRIREQQSVPVYSSER
jgi:8-amino-7-oxononanoate synthase